MDGPSSRRTTVAGTDDRLESALAAFEAVGGTDGALETLRSLVDCCRDRGDDVGARTWRRRAEDLLEGADDSLRSNHEWIGEQREVGG